MRYAALIVVSLCVLVACGGSGSSPSINNDPMLSLDEAGAMVVDQFYINGGLDDEYTTRGEFSVYLRDAATGRDIACATEDGGMKWLSAIGIYYGGLSVPLEAVQGDPPAASVRFKVIFVEKDSESCPAPIDRDDDIAGESNELTFDDLLGKRIFATNGRAAVLFRAADDRPYTVEAMEPALADGLSIDKLYFEEGEGDDTESRYYIFVEEVEGDTVIQSCQVPDASLEKIRHGGIVYSALGIAMPCPSPTIADFGSKRVRISLYVQRESGPELIGETLARPIGELIGERVSFANGGGYVSFRAVMTTPFSAAIVRLGDLELVDITALSYVMTPPANSTVELHAIDTEAGYTVACAGTDQGFTGIGSPGNFTGLSAGLVAASGVEGLFGFGSVQLKLVARTGGLECPAPFASGPRVLGSTEGLESHAFAAGGASFEDGAGHLSFSLSR